MLNPTATRRTEAGSPLLLGTTLLLYLVSAGVGFLLGFAFVRNAGGGAVMGLAAGLNGALFCTLLVDGLLTRLIRRRRES